MNWNKSTNNEYESYAYVKKKPIVLSVTQDGRYSGYISNHNERNTRPELFISGKCHTPEEAMEYVEKIVEKLNEPKPPIKKVEIPKEVAEELYSKTEEDYYVENLSSNFEDNKEDTQKVDTTSEETEEIPESVEEVEESIIEEQNNSDSLLEIIISEGFATIKCNVEGIVKYTTNGREVSTASKIYKEPFPVDGIELIKMKVYDSEKNVIAESEYSISVSDN